MLTISAAEKPMKIQLDGTDIVKSLKEKDTREEEVINFSSFY